MVRMIRVHFFVIALACLLTGCSDQRILERLGFIHTSGFDLVPKNEDQPHDMLQVTVTLPMVNAHESKLRFESLTAVAKTSKEAKFKMSKQTDLALVSGQLRNILFGTSLAKKGLWNYLDTYMRDPAISQRVKITIVNGNAGRIVSKNYEGHPPTGQYIDRMLDKETSIHTIPEVSLYEFSRDYFDDGIDPVVPVIKDLGKHIGMDGIALFDEDRYVTKLNADEGILFSILSGSLVNGNISVDLGEVGNEGEYVFSTLSSKRRVKISHDGALNRFAAEIRLHLGGTVLEYTGDMKLSEEQDQKRLEQLVSSYLAKKFEEMMKKMQKNKVDSLGIGKYVRNSLSYAKWTQLDWDAIYPSVDVKFNVSVKIKNYGKFEK